MYRVIPKLIFLGKIVLQACPEVDTQPVDSQPKITAIVTDTNVFMHDLAKIRELLEFKGGVGILFYTGCLYHYHVLKEHLVYINVTLLA